MSLIDFYKYQGAGNDFVMIQDLDDKFPESVENIKKICHRRFGVGADGLILVKKGDKKPFKMVYFNSDGNESSMCGNGGRCFVKFIYDLKLVDSQQIEFEAIDGFHEGKVLSKEPNSLVQLGMTNVSEVQKSENHVFLDTGSPHHVEFLTEVESIDVKEKGSSIRYSELYKPKGTNVNFVRQIDQNNLEVRTYERGVEDETYSCGTGVTAAALATHFLSLSKSNSIKTITKGGELLVEFTKTDLGYENIKLTGKAELVFKGTFEF